MIIKKINSKIDCINNIIKSEIENTIYNSSEFTIQYKIIAYKSIFNLLDRCPEKMIPYLYSNSRSGKLQSKLFQEYISLLEESLPFSFKKKGKEIRVESLFDANLFDGVSVFDEVISSKLEIKNSTKEFYIGGRKSAYTKPFYLGKILNIINVNDSQSLMNNILEYSFNKIKMKNISPGINVRVMHLRIPPHYQMGGMVYINRARKKIVESL